MPPPTFDDPAATWDSTPWQATPSAALNAALQFPSLRAELVWFGHITPASHPPVLGMALGVDPSTDKEPT